MMLRLKGVLEAIGQPQSALASALKVSPATVAQLVNHGQWPRSQDRECLQQGIQRWLLQNKANVAQVLRAFEEVKEGVEPPRANATAPAQGICDEPSAEDNTMLMRKQTLTQTARKRFNLFSDPFGELTSPEDMWVSQDLRYVREQMYQVARRDGFLAVVGESGAGKSTLRRDLENRLRAEGAPVVLVQPHVLASEDRDTIGKPLQTSHIIEAILKILAPELKLQASPEVRAQQLYKTLVTSHEAGFRHCVLIEEAHSLPTSTLRQLKRLREFELGFTKLVSVILIGQTELKVKLSERAAEVREVVQRIEMVELGPIAQADFEGFLSFRLGRAEKQLGDVIDASGVQALTERLTSTGRDASRSMLYPLAVANLVTASINLAAQLGEPRVTGDIVRGVQV
jgi:type II secretory pathway predicted ATPase ExeA